MSIFIFSLSRYLPTPTMSAYCASKAALDSVARSLRAEVVASSTNKQRSLTNTNTDTDSDTHNFKHENTTQQEKHAQVRRKSHTATQ